MPESLPDKRAIDAAVKLLTDAGQAQAGKDVDALQRAAQRNIDEATSLANQIVDLRKQLDSAQREGAAARSKNDADLAKLRNDATARDSTITDLQKQLTALRAQPATPDPTLVGQIEDLRSQLGAAQRDKAAAADLRGKNEADLAQLRRDMLVRDSKIADLETQLADLSHAQAPPADESRPIAELIGELRAEAQQLFMRPATAEAAPGPRVVVEGLAVELRGSLTLGDRVGLRAFTAAAATPEAASIIRFSLKPETRIVVAPDET